MKKIFYLLFAGVLLLASCQKPQFVEPTAERQGITSLTAYFTSGPYVEKELGKLTVTDPETDRYVIPIPWFYPEESEEGTTTHMSRVRVRAELAENCKIDPPLTILNLFEENQFTFTNAQGESKSIVITGERVKSSKTEMIAFNLVDDKKNVVLEGFVDNDESSIYLFSVDDLNGYTAVATPWYHASIKEASKISEPLNWNEEQTVTVVAHDGKTETAYKVIKRNPEKIDYGINAATFKELFNLDPVVYIGAPDYKLAILPSIAYVEGYLVVNFGNGSNPIYLDGRNGSRLGEIQVGGKAVGAVTNDEGGNLILCNRLTDAGTFEIYKTSSVKAVPELFYSYESTLNGYPLGSKIKVCGDINKDARITVQYEGVDGAASGSFLEFTVVGGSVVDVQLHDLYVSAGISWGVSPAWAHGLVPASAEAGVNGYYYAAYSIDGMQWIKPDLTVGETLKTNDTDNAWLLNPSCLDSKKFNNANYLALLVCHHFPAWGGQPSVWLYDISNPSTVSGTYQESSALVAYNSWITFFNMTNHEVGTQSSGDVVIAPSADGFKMYVYYYDHYAGTIGGYVADCVKK